MIKRSQLVCCVLNHIDPNILLKYSEDLDSRILAQKIIYLVQENGYDLGFRFCWYHRGPYSSELADYINDVIMKGVE